MKSTFVVAVTMALVGPLHAQESTVIDSEAFFPEGPLVRDGVLYFAEYAGNVVTSWDGAALKQVWQQDGCGPSAVVQFGEGFAITCYDSGQIVTISLDGQTIDSLAADAAGVAMIGPNDGTPDGHGGAYFTLSGPWESGPIVGRIVHLDAAGTLREVANDLHYANGIAMGADGRLYVNESEAGRVVSFAVASDGSLGDRRLFLRLYALGEAPEAYPDGIKLGVNGNFFIGLYSAPNVLEVSPDGVLVNKYVVASSAAPNIAFSADGKTMFVTAVDNVLGAPYEGQVIAVALE